MSKKNKGLTARHKIFIAEYLKCKNQTEAARRTGVPAKSARTMGARWFARVDVKQAIDAGLARVMERAELKASDVLAELRKLAFAKVKDAFTPEGEFVPLHEMPEDLQAAIAGIEHDEISVGRGEGKRKIGVTRKVKFADKVRSLELLGKYFKLFTEVHEAKVDATVAVVDEAQAKAALDEAAKKY